MSARTSLRMSVCVGARGARADVRVGVRSDACGHARDAGAPDRLVLWFVNRERARALVPRIGQEQALHPAPKRAAELLLVWHGCARSASRYAGGTQR